MIQVKKNVIGKVRLVCLVEETQDHFLDYKLLIEEKKSHFHP